MQTTYTRSQIEKACKAAGIAAEFTGRGRDFSVELADDKVMRKFRKTVAPFGGYRTGYIVGWDDANGPREARYDTRAEAEEHGEMLANYGIRYSIHAEGNLSPRERIEAILEADRDNRP